MWYFIEDNQRRGSFSLEEMESLANQGDINENTLVWKKGMKDWQPLVQTELKDILPDDMPPPVEVVILVQEVSPHSSTTEEISPSLKQRLAFLKLPMTERRNILESQAEIMLSHYQQDSEWQELMAGDIIDY